MPESRDRLVREVDFAAVYARSRSIGVHTDELDRALFGSRVSEPVPVERPGTVFGPGFRPGSAGSRRRRDIQTRRRRYASRSRGIENASAARSGERRSDLPSWYPRTPLQDISAILRSRLEKKLNFDFGNVGREYQAIERRRGRQGEVQGQEIGSPTVQGPRVAADSFKTPNPVHLKQGKSKSPYPASSSRVKSNPRPKLGKVQKLIHEIANQPSPGAECLTPEKKLLNSIDKVGEAVKQELDKLKRTPAAKKEEREKRVRTLMSMR
ncbi:unnamed protein product [Linum tenue]|uniref:Protein POLYCHOME n=1 Tax=Linum tenue TaxID=586396 RepID=A0AAV0ILE6_9ROSI|nr:unnamed protein product [Linum tenue]